MDLYIYIFFFFYKGRVTVSERPPYNNRRASVHLHRRTVGERHGCTKGPVPLSRINLRMTTDEEFAAVLRSAGKVPGSFKRFKTSVALLRSGASVKHPGRCPNSSFLVPNASLSASVTFPERPSIKHWRMTSFVTRPNITTDLTWWMHFRCIVESHGLSVAGLRPPQVRCPT